MTSKKYTYNSKATNGRERVNVRQLYKTVKALEKKIQVLLNESFHDRIAILEIARWRKPFHAVKRWFGKWVRFVTGK